MNILDMFNQNKQQDRPIKKPYIIAEAGVNHEGNIELAKRLIDEAAEAGAHAIKFQTYKANSIASKNSPSYWDKTKEPTDSQYELFKKYDKFWKDEFVQLKKKCDLAGIEFLSTPFDVESAKFLNEMMDVYKISSSDITNKPFIEYICDFGKPILLSTGASHLYEIQQAVEWIDNKNTPVSLLHCILNYPTNDEFAHLGMIKDLAIKFPDKVIGYSDHTLPKDMKVLEMATLLGASILEKHFTHDKTLPGNDHYHAMDKHDLMHLNSNLNRVFNLLGDQKKYPLSVEESARNNARRSLVATMGISAGTTVSREHLTWKRPAHGISPKEIDSVIGMQVVENILEDQVLQWSNFKQG